ncbi:hypothetical protein [Amycolatopsis sp. CA-126428]|uniref:hypothetical protein n=1 Tax=Amycolatopsis sp. CA-126428 TaxID=2073158 RepID=UPI000CD05AE0|nr:hypothetical protein [Amycolatopsis sp. CA-126428]
MASLEDLEARVTALEEQVQHTRQDAAAARVLAGTADRDVSDFKQTLNGHTRVLNAVRETQIEHGQRLDRLESRFDQLDAKVDSGFTKVNIGMEQMSRLLQQVIDKS